MYARVEILTQYPTPEIKCNGIKNEYIFSFAKEYYTGYINTDSDTVRLYCRAKWYRKNTARIDSLDSSKYNFSQNTNNFWIGYNFDFRSLAEMEIIVKRMMKNINGIYYFTLNEETKFISLKNCNIIYYYFLENVAVIPGDSLFFAKKSLPPPLPY